jgi:response regulator RpfG family c-di-GMP phosphodiesterase
MKKVLYVDSNELNTEIFVNALKNHGLGVATFNVIEDVMDHALQDNFSVIFIDIDFSNQIGLNLAQMIKDNDLLKETSVFMVGKADANEVAWMAMDYGCEQYYSRPLNFDDILPQIELYLKSNEDIQKILISDDDSELEELLDIFLDASYEEKIVIEKTSTKGEAISLEALEKTLNSPDSEEELLNLIEESFIGAKPSRVSDIYKKVKAARLNNPNLRNLNVYVKLGKEHFVKIINREDEYSPDALTSYLAKGVTSFYLDQESFSNFALSSLEAIQDRFGNGDLDKNSSVILQFESIAEIRKVVQDIGIKPAVIAVADEVVKSVMELAKKEDKLFNLLKDFYDKTDYVTTHAQFMNYIFAAIVSKIPGSHSSQDTLNKFIRASMLCDIVLKNNELACIQNLESEEYKSLNWRVQKSLEGHMKSAVELLEDSKLVTDDELNFINNHHERPLRKGWPRRVDGKALSLLTCYFIAVYDFTDRLLRSPKKENINPQRILESMEDLYNEGSFKKALQTLLDQFK